jgi:uncharacterized protein
MSINLQPERLNVLALAQDGAPVSQTTALSIFERLSAEGVMPEAPSPVVWRVQAQMRPAAGGDEAVWMHLTAQTCLALTCQRCMAPVVTPLQADQWYRFVADEDTAMAEDDEAEEDLLVMAPQFDLLSLIEDELLMALPLVPMHDTCPAAPALSAGEDDLSEPEARPNPFAVLGQLKKKPD